MAEANATSDKDPSKRVTTEFSVTDRSICLEQLRKPKSLPCLHTFCQDCLSTFITSHDTQGTTPVFFNCPVCRRKTVPMDPSSTNNLWASQFPTNNFVVEMIKKFNPEANTKHLCHPCLKRENKENPASCWCQDCGNFQCEECNIGHKRYLFDHRTISIEELSQGSAVLIPVQEHCEKHGKNIELICIDHTMLCCHLCIAIDHRKCDNVATVIEYAENLKSEKLTELAQDIDESVSNIDSVIAEFHEKLDALAKDKDTAMQKLSDTRQWLDSQMSKMSDEVMNAYQVETEKIHRKLEDMATVRSSLLQTKAYATTSQQTGNEHQLVSTVIRGKSEMERCEQIVQNKPDENVRINIKLRKDFEKIIIEKEDIGRVEVHKDTKSLFRRTVKQVGTIKLPSSCHQIRKLIILPTGYFIVTDRTGKQLLYITDAGGVLSTLKLDGTPWDMFQMPDGDFAVSVNGRNKIVIVRLSSSQISLIRTIQITENPLGITFCNGILYSSTLSSMLFTVTDNGRLKQHQQLKNNSQHLTCSKSGCQIIGSIFESNPANPAVYRVSRDNTYTEVIKADIVKKAAGIDVDDEDNIYVCGYGSHNVVQISADGTETKELLTSPDVNCPYAVNVCGDKMYINEFGKPIIKINEFEQV